MKRGILLIAIVLIAILSSSCKNSRAWQQGTNAQNKDSIKAEIERILKVQEDAYAQHNEDGNRIMQSTCVDSILYVGTDGGIMLSSYDYSHDLANGWIDRPRNKIFKFYNNTVIVTSIYKSYYLHNGDTLFINNRMTKIFVKDNNQWKMAHEGVSPLPVSYYKSSNYTNGNPALNPNYVGVYQIDPTKADTILLINGDLYAANTKDSRRYKLFSINDSTFMAEGYMEKMIFGIGINRKVTHYSLELYDGQRIHYPKVK